MKNTVTTLRFDDDQSAKLKALASKYKVTDAQIIRWALDALHDYVEAHGGRCMLPIDFDALWTQVQATAPATQPSQSPPKKKAS